MGKPDWPHALATAPGDLSTGMPLLTTPADLAWFELDQPDVVAAKQQLLRKLLAEVPGAAQSSRGSGSGLDDLPAEPGSPVESGLSRHLRYTLGSAVVCKDCRGHHFWLCQLST